MTDYRGERGPCVLPHAHEPDRVRPAITGLRVCAGHRQELERLLVGGRDEDTGGRDLGLAELHRELAGMVGSAASGAGEPSVSGTPGRRMEYRPEVSDAMSHIVWKVHRWGGRIARERGERLGEDGNWRIAATVRYLESRIDWCCGQPWIGEYFDELRAVRHRAIRLVFPAGGTKFVVARCGQVFAPDHEGGARCCIGWLWARVPGSEQLPKKVVCDTCDTEHPPHNWMRLAERILRQRAAARSA